MIILFSGLDRKAITISMPDTVLTIFVIVVLLHHRSCDERYQSSHPVH